MVTHLLVSRRRGAFACAVVFAALTASPCSHAQTMTEDPDYHPQFRTRANLRVFPQADGNLVALGATYLGDTEAPPFIRFTPDGTILDGMVAWDAASWTYVRLPDGRSVHAALRSTNYGWEAGDHRFAFITVDANGTTLASFEVAAVPDPGWGVPPPVRSVRLRLLPDGRVMAGGNFTGGLLRIAANGTRDTSFESPLDAAEGWFRDLIVLDDNSVVIARGGQIENFAATGVAGLRRFRPNGSLDSTFSATLADPSLHLTQAGGKILVGGTHLRRLRSDGVTDSTFDASAAGFERIISVHTLGNGKLLVAGAQSGNTPAVCVLDENGALVRNLRDIFHGDAVALDGLGTQGNAWVRHGPAGFTARSSSPDQLWDVVIAKPRLARVTVDGTHPSPYVATEVTITPEPLVDGEVTRLLSDEDGRIVMSGTFDRIDGLPHYRIARLLPDGSVDPAFAPPDLGAESSVSVVHPDGRILVRNPSDGSAVSYARLLADGSADSSLAAGSTLASSALVEVVAVAADGGYVAKRHQAYDESPAFAEVHRYRADGSMAWSTHNPAGISSIGSIGTTAEGRVVIYGLVDSDTASPGDDYIAPVSELSARMRLIALRAEDGTLDDSYRPVFPAGTSFEQIVVLPDGTALVALATYTNGLDYSRHTVRVLTDGSLDPNFRLNPDDEYILAFSPVQATHDGGLLARTPRSVSSPAYGSPLGRRLRDGALVPEFRVGLPYENYTSILLTGDDVLYMAGRFTTPQLTPARLVRSLPTRTPGIVRQPSNATTTAGESVALITAVGDGGPVTYQWQRDGVNIEGATSSRLFLDRIEIGDAGSYRCIVRSGHAVYATDAANVVVSLNTTRLVNFSARSRVDLQHTLIGGIVVDEASGQPALLRTIGSALPWDLGVPLLRDPMLSLYQGNIRTAQNRGGAWDPDILALGDRLGAFRPLEPTEGGDLPGPTNSALAQTLTPGIYTVHTTPNDGQAGVSLFEYYDADPDSPQRGVANLSIRAQTGPGADVLIGGFVISGTGNARLLIRAVGPGLESLGVPNTARDPRIIVRASDRAAPDATNDNWSGDPEIAAAVAEAGAFELASDSKDAALVVSLPAGAYTVQVPAADGERGEVLVEIYVLDR